MKKCLFILFINLLLTSCSTNDDIVQEQQNRGLLKWNTMAKNFLLEKMPSMDGCLTIKKIL